MLGRVTGGSDDGGVQVVQQGQALAEHADGVVVAAQQQQGHFALVQLRNQAVVQGAGVAGRGAGVKNITSNQHGIHRMCLDLLQHPVDQDSMLALAAVVHEVLAKVPVRGVEDAHTGSAETEKFKTKQAS